VPPKILTRSEMKGAFKALDQLLPRKATLIVGGGTAMVLAHDVPVRTTDVDAYSTGMSFEELEPFARKVAKERDLAQDWLNPHYSTYAFVLPASYSERLVAVFEGANLTVKALGAEDLLVMKCFAGREKDIGHARALFRKAKQLEIVESRLQELVEKNIPKALEAADFFDELKELEA
jgi:predicted nucleotidyltransferase